MPAFCVGMKFVFMRPYSLVICESLGHAVLNSKTYPLSLLCRQSSLLLPVFHSVCLEELCGWTCGTWVERTIASMFCTFLAWLQLTPCKARQVQGSENVGQAQKSCFQFSPQFQCLFRRQYECIPLLIHGLACFLQVLLRQSVFVQLFFWTPKDKTFYSCLHLDSWGSPALLQLWGIFYISQFFS